MVTKDEIAKLQQTFTALYNSLTDAYWAASTLEAKDQIHGAEDLVNSALNKLDHADIEADNDAITDLTDSLKASVKDLGNLQAQLNTIVHNVAVASTAIQAITKALEIAGKIAAI